jgi:hypothetical protein
LLLLREWKADRPPRRPNQNTRVSSSVLGEWRDAIASTPERVGGHEEF